MTCAVLLFVFFFFKQKTAYEMRISDWSSDVCSSDLWLSLDDKLTSDDILVSTLQNPSALGSLEEYGSESGTFTVPKRFRGTVYILVATDSGNRIDEWPNDTVQSNIVAHEIHVDPIPFADLEIGRASCRARVCQQV